MRFRYFASICLMALLPFSFGCGSSTDAEFNRHLSHGKKFLEASEYPEASREFRSAVQIRPDSAEGRYNLGLSYLKMGGPSNSLSAFREFTKAVELDPAHKGSRVKLAELYLSSRNFDQALKMAESVYREDRDKEARMLMAGAFAGKKDYEKALDIMEDLLEAKPASPGPYMFAAAIYAAAGDDSRAEEMLKEAVAAFAADFTPRAALAAFYYRHKRLTEAENELRKAAAELPDKMKALRALANFHVSAGNLDEAEKTLRAALQVEPARAEAFIMLAGFYKASGKPFDAEGVLAAGLEKFPDNMTLRKKYAELLLDLGKQDEAEKHIKTVSSIEPNGYYSLYLAGRLKASRGQLPEAQADLQASIKEEPAFPVSHYSLGRGPG